MPKVQAIINQLQSKTFDELPQVSHILESDIQRLNEAIKKPKNDRSYYAILRVVLAQVKRKLGHKDYTKPLLEISLSQLQGKPYINDLKLRICQAIIDCEQLHRMNLLQHTVNTLTTQNLKDPQIRARLQTVRAGNQYFRGDYTKAAIYYLNASREEALVKNQQKKLALINKSIAFCYAAPRSSENHKTICALCLNELSKKSHLKEILNKLYTEDIMTREDCEKLEKQLPISLSKADIDGVSVFNQAKFSHNMIPIINSFKIIKFKTLSRLLSMDIDQVLILLEKTYGDGQLKINQEEEIIQFLEQYEEESEKLRAFLNKVDEILQVQ